MGTKKIKFEDIQNSHGKTSKEELDKMTNAQINEGAQSDPNSFVTTDDELKEFEKVGKKDKART